LKPLFEPSAQDFLDSRQGGPTFRAVFDHVLDEVRQLTLDPAYDGQTKLVFELPYPSDRFYRILWGQPFRGEALWYVYEADYDADVLYIYNIGISGLETPFLSRR
jgi:hypothetical protein